MDTLSRKGAGSHRLTCATVALLAAVCCHNAARVDERPIDEAAVREVMRRTVTAAVDEAERSSTRIARDRADRRRDRLAGYIDATARSIEAFRAAVPRLDPGAELDISEVRLALEEAAAARAALSESPGDLLRLYATLDLGAAYLDALASALGSVEAGEPSRDPTAFLDRYQRLVERYDAWAEAARRDVESMNADGLGAFMEASRDARRRYGVALLRGSWPRDLVATCESALESVAEGTALPAERLLLQRELAEVVASDRTELPQACRAAVEPVVEGYSACAETAGGRVEGEGAVAAANALDELRDAVARFATAREQACPSDAEGSGPSHANADAANAGEMTP